MTLKKPLFIKDFLLVDRNTRLLLYQRFFNGFLKIYLSDFTKKFLWGIIHYMFNLRYFLSWI
ncbi:peptidase [Enterococcus faecium]|nr:peptidase [Enterococcus faecium]RSA56309.1 peptidase [Enterococcus faecium]RSA64896.1 peptidase [Enterococcus faecium]RYJ81747.1 peptidase [Enterococcus faecium]